VNATGNCYSGAAAYGLCHTGTENPCGTGNKCMAATGTEPGGWGWCVPNAAKACVNPGLGNCPSGFQCISLGVTVEVPSGVCTPDALCIPGEIELDNLMWTEMENARLTYEYDLDAEHQAMVVSKIKALTSE